MIQYTHTYTNTRYTGEDRTHRDGRQERDKGEVRCHQPKRGLWDRAVQTGRRPMGEGEGAEADEPFHVHRCSPNL